nr:TPA_asm: NADH dehydrogenase subunit 5 [Pseudomyrmex veneficus]
MYNMLVYSLFMFVTSILFVVLSLLMKLIGFLLVLEWLVYSFKSMNMTFYLMVDWVSMQFMGIVLLISSMVMLYSTVYMSNELNLSRFYLLVFMFIISMILMILSPNLISILIGWDGLGLVSYCLVIYYNNYMSYNSGMVTVLSNRVGDVGILMSIGLVSSYGSWSTYMLDNNILIMFFVLIGAITKSAQIPFSYWLPQAMAAPTPVSSLVHSSTLVTAGIYLLIRFNELLKNSGMGSGLFSLSLLTMFMAGLMANFEYDLKKIIALSTLSQLGLMMMILSVGVKNVAFFHLETHAIFKSLLFLCAGSMIHAMMNNQDIRYYGNMNEFIPFVMMSFYISSLSLCGMPFLSGFYSKDLIMDIFYSGSENIFIMMMACLSVCFTVSYTIRLIYYVYFGSVNFYSSWHLISSSWMMNISMFILMIMSVGLGSLLSWVIFFDFYEVFLQLSIKLITLVLCLCGVLMGLMFYVYSFLKFYFITYFISSMWMMMFIYSYIYNPIMNYWRCSNDFDKVWVEFASKFIIYELFESLKITKGTVMYSSFMFCYLILFYLIYFISI